MERTDMNVLLLNNFLTKNIIKIKSGTRIKKERFRFCQLRKQPGIFNYSLINSNTIPYPIGMLFDRNDCNVSSSLIALDIVNDLYSAYPSDHGILPATRYFLIFRFFRVVSDTIIRLAVRNAFLNIFRIGFALELCQDYRKKYNKEEHLLQQ